MGTLEQIHPPTRVVAALQEAVPRLSGVAQDRLAAARVEVEALEALDSLAALLDPDGERTRWWVACAIGERLHRFEQAAWPRIRSGGRAPQGALERLLCAVTASRLPRDPRRLWDLLGPRA